MRIVAIENADPLFQVHGTLNLEGFILDHLHNEISARVSDRTDQFQRHDRESLREHGVSVSGELPISGQVRETSELSANATARVIRDDNT